MHVIGALVRIKRSGPGLPLLAYLRASGLGRIMLRALVALATRARVVVSPPTTWFLHDLLPPCSQSVRSGRSRSETRSVDTNISLAPHAHTNSSLPRYLHQTRSPSSWRASPRRRRGLHEGQHPPPGRQGIRQCLLHQGFKGKGGERDYSVLEAEATIPYILSEATASREPA